MILGLSYLLLALLTQLGAISSQISIHHLTTTNKKTEPVRTASETNFILSDYGVWIEPRKLGRKERFALALTNLADSGQ